VEPAHWGRRQVPETITSTDHDAPISCRSHVWQHAHGKPTRNGYHNKEWAAKMDNLGLVPSSTGGKRTGQSVSHYIAASDGQERAPGQIRLRRLRRGRVGQGGPEPRLRRLRGGHGADRIAGGPPPDFALVLNDPLLQ
jgi:hypothetical protein